jgi:hypothetical protein
MRNNGQTTEGLTIEFWAGIADYTQNKAFADLGAHYERGRQLAALHQHQIHTMNEAQIAHALSVGIQSGDIR